MVPATYTLYGTEYTERVGTITWTGGPLPDGQLLDFGINATFQLEPGEYTLPVIQYCGDESVAWVEVPAAGQTHDDLEHPAPEFVVVDAAATDGHTDAPAATATDPLLYIATLFAVVAALALIVYGLRTSAKSKR
ncbi:DUF1775 domain-containing protein [bacterium]|nr:DUF1775 domain-containing protein [bacterium]